MIFATSVALFAELHVQHPVLLILDGPMGADTASKRLLVGNRTQEIAIPPRGSGQVADIWTRLGQWPTGQPIRRATPANSAHRSGCSGVLRGESTRSEIGPG